MTTTSTYNFTFTETAVYLADVILGSVADVVAALGLSPATSATRVQQDETAIIQWIKEKSLDAVVLEFTDSRGIAVEVFEFDVVYKPYGDADSEFYADRASLARYRAKLKQLPSGTTWRLVCTYRTAHTTMPGWTSTTRASTDGMRSTTFGTLGAGPGASSTLRRHSR